MLLVKKNNNREIAYISMEFTTIVLFYKYFFVCCWLKKLEDDKFL